MSTLTIEGQSAAPRGMLIRDDYFTKFECAGPRSFLAYFSSY